MKLLAAVIFLLLFGLAGRAAAQQAASAATFRIVAERSMVHFAVKSPVGRARAQMPVQSGELYIEPDGRITGGTATLDAAAMTGSGAVLGSLKGASGFAVSAHPSVQFAVTDGHLTDEAMRLSGMLTVRGVTHGMELDGKIARSGANRIAAELRGTIDRTLYGVTAGRPVYSRTADVRLRLVVGRGR